MITRNKILKALQRVKDPEIPALSIVDLGIVRDIIVNEEGSVEITLTPTFVGCPAMKMIEDSVYLELVNLGIRDLKVRTTFDSSWNSNMITERGKDSMKKNGIAPPMVHNGSIEMPQLLKAECPYCGSADTEIKSLFGSALCKSIRYCNGCLQAFEQFKPVV